MGQWVQQAGHDLYKSIICPHLVFTVVSQKFSGQDTVLYDPDYDMEWDTKA